jgi:hypothetical protein
MHICGQVLYNNNNNYYYYYYYSIFDSVAILIERFQGSIRNKFISEVSVTV